MANQADDFETRMANYTYQRPNNPVRNYGIVLAGKTGCGKSSTANNILGRKAFEEGCSGQSVTGTSSYATSVEGDRTITVVDTPGVHGNVRPASVIKKEIARMAFLLREGVHSFVICMNASESRVTGETKQFLDQVKVSGHADFFDYCILVYTKAESELCDASLNTFVEKQKEHADMKTFLDKIGDRMLAVNNKAGDPREKERNKDAIIAMVDKTIVDNIIKNKPVAFTNDTFKAANELLKQVVSVVERERCHPSLVNAVIEAVIWYSNWGTIEENAFVEKVIDILHKSEQCEEQGANLVFRNDDEVTITSVVVCEKHIKMIYQTAQSEISLFYTVLGNLLTHKGEIACTAGLFAGLGVLKLLGVPAVILYTFGKMFY